ncbi:MAG: polyamine aminopropyltransferase [Clostridia bacterium]|nr:MAG: polyamine aminopropyltransferase [Clostridia bacterium]
MPGTWFSEKQLDSLAISCVVKKILHSERTPYQQIKVLDTDPFGLMLALDDVIQTTVFDEFAYHEMIALVPLNVHPDPKRILVIGGGDGGTVRECLRHPSPEEVTLVEIDARVVEVSRQYLPQLSSGLDDPRVKICYEDGTKYLKGKESAYDVIIVDSTDPVGPARGLFEEPFYRQIERALAPEGILVAQTESPFYNLDLIKKVFATWRGIFPTVRIYEAVIPSYPGGLWTFTLGSKKHDPVAVRGQVVAAGRYYSPAVHQAAFVLPNFLQGAVR